MVETVKNELKPHSESSGNAMRVISTNIKMRIWCTRLDGTV